MQIFTSNYHDVYVFLMLPQLPLYPLSNIFVELDLLQNYVPLQVNNFFHFVCSSVGH